MKFEVGGMTFTLHSRGDMVVRVAGTSEGRFEWELSVAWAKIASQARCMVDVGAYTGYYSIMAAKVNPSCRVLAFEPNPSVFGRLLCNIGSNAVKVETYNLALSNKSGPSELFMPSGTLLTSAGRFAEYCRDDRTYVSARIVTLPLDSFRLPHVDAMKIDTEGSEPAVIEGARNTIARSLPTIFAECLNEEALLKVRACLGVIANYEPEKLDGRNYAFKIA